MNTVVFTSVISAGNHALFAGTRVLYGTFVHLHFHYGADRMIRRQASQLSTRHPVSFLGQREMAFPYPRF
jgi:hypothetical protein